MDEELKRSILEKFGKGHSYKELDFLSEVLKNYSINAKSRNG